MQDSEVESVTVQLANLEITITARPLAPSTDTTGSASSVAVSAAAVESSTPETIAFYQLGEQFEDRIIAAQTPTELIALSLRFLGIFTARLRGSGPWTPEARVARAYRAGIVARRQLGGLYQGGTSPATPFRNTVYVVLRARSTGSAFWTNSYPTYLAAVCQEGRLHHFHQDSVSHGFASQSEASAYLAGAHRQWPPEEQ